MNTNHWNKVLITLQLLQLSIFGFLFTYYNWQNQETSWNKVGILIQIFQLIILVIAAWLTYRGWQKDREKDRENTRDNMRLQYLSDAYILISDFVQRVPESTEKYKKHIQNIEKAADLINLFGTEEEIKEFEQFALEASIPNRQGNLDRILQMLRNRLRKELKLPEIMHPPRGIRITVNESGAVQPASTETPKTK